MIGVGERQAHTATRSGKSVLAILPSALACLLAIATVTADRTEASGPTGGVSPKVIGGTVAPPGSWPSQAALLLASRPDDGYQAQFCGGTLIDEGWVLTAAHCVTDDSGNVAPASAVEVAIGINDLRDIDPSDRIDLEAIDVIPEWDPATYDWDFALLELAAPSAQPVTELIAPGQGNLTENGDPAAAAGWGCAGATTCVGYPWELLQAGPDQGMAFVSDALCGGVSSYGTGFDPESMICAGNYDTGLPDTCFGDSGGPLIAYGPGDVPVLAGITSWGRDCALPNYPGVYSRVLAGLEWIIPTISSEYWLEVARVGTGQGTITSDSVGIDCGTSCAAKFTAGQSVELSAEPASGSTFTGWSGDCLGTGTCEVTIDQGRDVTANFTEDPPPPLPLTVSRAGTGQGTIASDPAGIDCGSVCLATFPDGSAVELTPTPASGSTFTGWSGDCSGTGTCVVTMSEARSVVADFTEDPPPPVVPTVTITGRPVKRTAKAVATFRFKSSQAGSTFRCRLDGRSWGKCSSPKTYRNLPRGRQHTFRVEATRDGLTGPVTPYRWFVKRR